MTQPTNYYVAVVDDDESVCRSLGRLLRAVGYQPVIYSSCEAFLADTKRPRFDCLVLDITAGVASGLELGQQLVASGSRIPIVLITAHDEPDVRIQAERIPCAAYLRNTEPAESVLVAIRRAIHSEGAPANG